MKGSEYIQFDTVKDTKIRFRKITNPNQNQIKQLETQYNAQNALIKNGENNFIKMIDCVFIDENDGNQTYFMAYDFGTSDAY